MLYSMDNNLDVLSKHCMILAMMRGGNCTGVDAVCNLSSIVSESMNLYCLHAALTTHP